MSEQKQEESKFDINDLRDHQRWLIDNGFINDIHKDQLYLFGAILHKDIQAVELDIDVSNRLVNYKLFASEKLLDKLDKYDRLSKSKGLFDLWRFRNMLKKEGNLNFSKIIDIYVKDYCGQKWRTQVKTLDMKDYEDGYSEQARDSWPTDKQPNG